MFITIYLDVVKQLSSQLHLLSCTVKIVVEGESVVQVVLPEEHMWTGPTTLCSSLSELRVRSCVMNETLVSRGEA